jgi:molybdopterin-containing oxidoreductase family iron-sulfur binding subunit
LTDLITGTLRDLVVEWLTGLGSHGHVMYEPFAYEPLGKAGQMVFGTKDIPAYRIDRSDFLVSFGADFLETWLSPVEYARQFSVLHDLDKAPKSTSIYVGPRLSLTGANADFWISVPPGTEYLVAVGMLRSILGQNIPTKLTKGQKENIWSMVKDLPLETISTKTGVTADKLKALAGRFALAKRPLALAGGMSFAGPYVTETAVAANLLCTVSNGTKETIDHGDPSSLGYVVRAEDFKELVERMRDGEIDLLILYQANPLFSLPSSWEFQKAMESIPQVVSFSSVMDETTQQAHLILPTHTPLESWGDYAPRSRVMGLMQPVMGTMFDTRHLGDILLSAGKKVLGEKKFPAKSFYDLLVASWHQKGRKQDPDLPAQSFWQEAMKRGGIWTRGDPKFSGFSGVAPGFAFPDPNSTKKSEKSFHFMTYPDIRLFDGRGSNRPWLQELPDPLTKITWGGWVEIHPETAEKLGIRRGDLLSLQSLYGTLEVPAYPYHGIPADSLAMPIGQGHTTFGRFAKGLPGNPARLLPPYLDALSGGIMWSVSEVTLEKQGRSIPVANTDGSLYQHGRGIAQAASLEQFEKAKIGKQKPHLRFPLPEGYDRKEDFYPAHRHPEFRWGMVIDLDRCIGCGACVVACNAENNVAIVGKKRLLQGREMFWLRVERYFEDERPAPRFIPMLCQHCDNAPCEPVCPVYAPHHSAEGLNNQVYNRCIGTRFCSQNCPYKVRRFNWFTFTRPEPLNWQLNPDVTVRQKGVMEKCSFCVQRIKEAKNRAKNERRKVKEGEITPACAQTCPTGALIFGNFKDPKSRASSLTQDPRAYQVMGHLNTKPAVIYLKKIVQRIDFL